MLLQIMEKRFQIGLVSYLNACPLGHGLSDSPLVQVHLFPPSGLAERMDAGSLDVALVPVVDYLARLDRWEISIPYGICSKGSVGTVKIFSPRPIEKIVRLVVDADSHTSINMARVLIHRSRGKDPELIGKKFSSPPAVFEEPTLLIGDKAWQVRHAEFVYDLGQLWREQFNLPFVYAVWAGRKGSLPEEIKKLLIETAEANFKRLDEIARLYGPDHGFSVEEAKRYFTENIFYPIGPKELAGLEKFKENLCG
jgi:chorismate dehydratase